MSVQTATEGTRIETSIETSSLPNSTIQTLATTTTTTATQALTPPNRDEGKPQMPNATVHVHKTDESQTPCETTTARVTRVAPKFARQETAKARDFFTKAALEASLPKSSSQPVIPAGFATPTKDRNPYKHQDTPRPTQHVQPPLVTTKFVPQQKGKTQGDPQIEDSGTAREPGSSILKAKAYFESQMPKINEPGVKKNDRETHLLEMLGHFDTLLKNGDPTVRELANIDIRQLLPQIRCDFDDILNPQPGKKILLKNAKPISQYNQLAKKCGVPPIDDPVARISKGFYEGKSTRAIKAEIAKLKAQKPLLSPPPVSEEDEDSEVESRAERPSVTLGVTLAVSDEDSEADEDFVVFHEPVQLPPNGSQSKKAWAWGQLKSVGNVVWQTAAKATKAVVDYGKSWLITATQEEIDAVVCALEAEVRRREEKDGTDELPFLKNVETKDAQKTDPVNDQKPKALNEKSSEVTPDPFFGDASAVQK